MELHKKKCIPCEKKNIKPFDHDTAHVYAREIPSWTLAENGKSISKKYAFADFGASLRFVNTVGDIAEMEGHHPDITINYNKVALSLSTHSIGGLTENDFIVAAKIDALEKFPH